MSEPSILKQVLIVEDDAKVRGALREVFVADGYQCRVAANGREGLDAFLGERPPLTLTDIKMPVMDGLEFLKRARAVDADAAIIDTDVVSMLFKGRFPRTTVSRPH